MKIVVGDSLEPDRGTGVDKIGDFDHLLLLALTRTENNTGCS